MARKKPTVYLDTSFVSAFWYERGDIPMLARRLRTREWWDLERRPFTVWTSAFSEIELASGTFPRQSECLRMVQRLRYLPVTTAVRKLVEALLTKAVVPPTKAADAAHLSISAVHGID